MPAPPVVRPAERWLLLAIVITALGLRLTGVDFGLPALYDPDEPLFVFKAAGLLRQGTLDPGWFGHPGTTTIYVLALIEAAVFGWGLVTGRWSDAHSFARATSADPGLIVLPGRIVCVLCGVACVWLTWAIARRLAGRGVALAAAAFLAANAVHVIWSQVIRTDVEATVFLLAAVLFALRALDNGTTRAFVAAGMCAGAAAATKWPAAVALAAPLGAAAMLSAGRQGRAAVRGATFSALATIVGLIAISPYLLIDWPLVLRDIGGEVKTAHLGATGGGPLYNLGWYVRGPLLRSFGYAGLIASGTGLIALAVRSPGARAVLLPPTLLFCLAILSQHLVWERWPLPVLPVVAIWAAYGLSWIARRLIAPPRRVDAVFAALALAVLVPMAFATRDALAERRNDTRALASAWLETHVPPGASVLVEYPAINLLRNDWRDPFPMGSLGCLDGRAIISGQNVAAFQRARGSAPVVDLGAVPPAKWAGCRADFVFTINYDRYLAESGTFPREIANYDGVLAGMRLAAAFCPQPGVLGGWIVRIAARPAPGDPPHPPATIRGVCAPPPKWGY